MGMALNYPNPSGRSTDHSDDILRMRQMATGALDAIGDMATSIYRESIEAEARILLAAADLLECHDATGISLDDWDGPLALVQLALNIIGNPDGFVRNGV